MIYVRSFRLFNKKNMYCAQQIRMLPASTYTKMLYVLLSINGLGTCLDNVYCCFAAISHILNSRAKHIVCLIVCVCQSVLANFNLSTVREIAKVSKA